MAWSDPATRTRSGPAPVPRGRSVPFVSRGDVVERRIENVDQSESGHWYLSWLDRRGASEAGGAPPPRKETAAVLGHDEYHERADVI